MEPSCSGWTWSSSAGSIQPEHCWEWVFAARKRPDCRHGNCRRRKDNCGSRTREELTDTPEESHSRSRRAPLGRGAFWPASSTGQVLHPSSSEPWPRAASGVVLLEIQDYRDEGVNAK